MGLNFINEKFVATCNAYGILAQETTNGVLVTENNNRVELVVENKDENNSSVNVNFYKTEETSDDFVTRLFNIYSIIMEQEVN